MALHTKIGNEIPRGAVQLSESDAVSFMRVIVDSWSKRSDVFFLTYSPGILSTLSALTGMYANSYYRNRLRLQKFGLMATYLPVVVIPAAVSFLSHKNSVQNVILIEKHTCAVCLEIRSTSFQLLAGVTYPMSLAPLVGFMTASRYYTYNVPPINDPKNLLKLYIRLSKPIAGITIGISALHFLTAAYLAHKQVTELATIKQKLMEAESEMDEKR